MDTNRFSALSGDVTEIPGSSIGDPTAADRGRVPKYHTQRFRKRCQYQYGRLHPPHLPTPISDPGRPKPPVTSSQTGPLIPLCLLPTNLQPFDKRNICIGGEIFDDFERDRPNHKMNWITWAIRAGNATLLEMFQHKIATMHQDLTNKNTDFLSRINFLEQTNANQSGQLLNSQKKMDTADKAAIQMVADLYKKATSNQ
jgi:hypothetical protein